jgi:hypothetical protein
VPKIIVYAFRQEVLNHMAQIEVEVPEGANSDEQWAKAKLAVLQLPQDADRCWGERVNQETTKITVDEQPTVNRWTVGHIVGGLRDAGS